MKLLIVALFVANWSYGDFAGEPEKSGPAVVPASRPPSAPPPAATSPHTPVPTPPAARGNVAAPSLAPASLWRLADSGGQVWVHADPDWLSRWVARRNEELAAKPRETGSGPPGAPTGNWTCTPAGCYRTH